MDSYEHREFVFTPLLAALLCAFTFIASAQQVLYEETFPHPGPGEIDFPISVVGWANDITNNPNRLFQEFEDDGAVFAFQGTSDIPINTAFYTTIALDTGETGPAFPTIDPSIHPAIIFSAAIRPGVDADNIEARFAVQMNSANWFVATNTLPVPAMHGPFRTYPYIFRRAASAWKIMTLMGTSAAIGETPAVDLSGNITGAGLVFTHSIDNGNYDFDNFRITTDLGKLTITSVSGGQATLSWPGAQGVWLQSSREILSDRWDDVPGSGGQSAAQVPIDPERMFFRLVKRE